MLKPKYIVLGVFLLAILAAGGALLFFGDREQGGEQIACTMEALMCPDGSYVGRSGPSCAFSACPAMPYVEGTLEQNQNGFRLVFGAPQAGQEVSYAMPLEIKVSNALADFVGKKVRVYGSFTEGAVFAVDRLEGLSSEESNPEAATLKVGESAYINGVRVTLVEIVSDSRCPADVQCIWEGELKVSVGLKSDTDSDDVELSSIAAPYAFDSFKVSIAGVLPAAHSGSAIQPGEYRITFKVEKNG